MSSTTTKHAATMPPSSADATRPAVMGPATGASSPQGLAGLAWLSVTTTDAAEGVAQVLARSLATVAGHLVTAAQDAATWSPHTRALVLATLDAAGRSVAAAKSPLIVAEEKSGAWRAPGVRSFDDARSRSTRAGKSATKGEVQDAHTVTTLDGGTEALAAGELTEAHVRRLRTAADKLPEHRRTLLLTGRGAAQLLDLARDHDAPTFARKVDDLIAARSAKDTQDAHEAVRATRHVTLRETPEGTHLSGLLDPVAGHTLRLALDAATPTPAAGDTRTRAQRHADAMVSLARNALDDGTFKAGAPVRPHVSLTMDAETFARAQAHQRAATQAADPATTLDPTTSELLSRPPVVRLDDGPLLPPSELGRLLCATDMTRMVVGAESQVLDVGRTQRLYAGHLRRAVVARDTHCVWDGCTMPARFCEVHHLDWWDEDHGHTSIERGALLCEFHHHELHTHNLDLTREPPPSHETGSAQAGRGSDSPERTRLPGEPGYEPPTYRTIPRSRTKRERDEARQHRLREEIYNPSLRSSSDTPPF